MIRAGADARATIINGAKASLHNEAESLLIFIVKLH